jgi:hypothetical protein
LPGYTLRGGYEGTTLRICSPEISGLSEKWIRIDAQIRSPVGFSGPEEGLLIYDSIGGAELGKLVRSGPNTQFIRLYRYVPNNRRLQICLESLGAGEAIIERIGVEYWSDSRNSLPATPR